MTGYDLRAIPACLLPESLHRNDTADEHVASFRIYRTEYRGLRAHSAISAKPIEKTLKVTKPKKGLPVMAVSSIAMLPPLAWAGVMTICRVEKR